MMKRQPANRVPLRRAPVTLAAALCCLLLAGCSEPAGTPEEGVRAWVDKGVELAKEKNLDEKKCPWSVGWLDPDGGNDRDAIEDMFRFYFLRAGDIALLTRIEELVVHGDSAAELLLTVGMAGRSDGVLGFSADAYRFEMELEREGADWLLIGARWAELGEELE